MGDKGKVILYCKKIEGYVSTGNFTNTSPLPCTDVMGINKILLAYHNRVMFFTHKKLYNVNGLINNKITTLMMTKDSTVHRSFPK